MLVDLYIWQRIMNSIEKKVTDQYHEISKKKQEISTRKKIDIVAVKSELDIVLPTVVSTHMYEEQVTIDREETKNQRKKTDKYAKVLRKPDVVRSETQWMTRN